jgi:hypothetical protein
MPQGILTRRRLRASSQEQEQEQEQDHERHDQNERRCVHVTSPLQD